jgi:hypothetical protein
LSPLFNIFKYSFACCLFIVLCAIIWCCCSKTV